MSTPDQQLTAFFQRLKAKPPVCESVSVAPDKTRAASHIATWTTEETVWEGHTIPAVSQSAEASKKKAAVKAAAQLAVEQLQSHPAWKASIPEEKSVGSVLSVIQTMLSDQVSVHVFE
jgi:hypothetical protein